MRIRLTSLILFAGMLCSCDDNKKRSYLNEEAFVSIPGLPFRLEQSIFLNQYANPLSRTTSWLLADSGFNNNQSLPGFFNARGNGKLCILHWSQVEDPVWIGARIPGQFLGADLLMYENDTLVVEQYNPDGKHMRANESYKQEVEKLIREVDIISYP